MKKAFQLFFVLLLGLWLGIGSLIAQIDKVRVEPPNWWAGMACSELQVMENTEAQVSLDFAKSYGYFSPNTYIDLVNQSKEVGKMLNHLVNNPEKNGPRN